MVRNSVFFFWNVLFSLDTGIQYSGRHDNEFDKIFRIALNRTRPGQHEQWNHIGLFIVRISLKRTQVKAFMKTQNSSIKTQNAEILSKLRIYESVGGSELQILFTFNIFPVAVTVFALMIKGHLCVTIQTIQTHGLWWHWGEDQWCRQRDVFLWKFHKSLYRE